MKAQIFLMLCIFAAPAFAGEKQKVMYEIPAPEALQPYSRFQIQYESSRNSDGTTEIRYHMPALLLGKEQEFRFRGFADALADSFTLSSTGGEMKCSKLTEYTFCHVVHKNVKVDLRAVSAGLVKMPISAEEKLGRFELSSFVARREGGDMIGVLLYYPEVAYK